MGNAGVIGLGQIGAGVAICLARSSQLAAVYDVRADAADTLDGVPPVVASPAELARQADVVIIAVVNARQTIDVLSGPDGVLSQARPGMSIVLVATVSIEAQVSKNGQPGRQNALFWGRVDIATVGSGVPVQIRLNRD